MRHVAHFCVAFLAQSDAEATPMRHRFGPKRRPLRDDAEKARWYRGLSTAHPCTKVTHAVHFAPGGRGSAKKPASAPGTRTPCSLHGESRKPAARCLAGPALFHHPRSCQAKVNETFRGHFRQEHGPPASRRLPSCKSARKGARTAGDMTQSSPRRPRLIKFLG